MSVPHLSLGRRSLLSAAGGVGALAALTACGGVSEGSSSSGGDARSWFGWSGSTQEVDAWKQVAEMVTTADSGTKVEFRTAAWNDSWTKLTSQAASGAAADLLSGLGGR